MKRRHLLTLVVTLLIGGCIGFLAATLHYDPIVRMIGGWRFVSQRDPHERMVVDEPFCLHVARNTGGLAWRLECMGANFGNTQNEITKWCRRIVAKFGHARLVIVPADVTITVGELREALKFVGSLGFKNVEIDGLISGYNEVGRWDDIQPPPPPPPPPHQDAPGGRPTTRN